MIALGRDPRDIDIEQVLPSGVRGGLPDTAVLPVPSCKIVALDESKPRRMVSPDDADAPA